MIVEVLETYSFIYKFENLNNNFVTNVRALVAAGINFMGPQNY